MSFTGLYLTLTNLFASYIFALTLLSSIFKTMSQMAKHTHAPVQQCGLYDQDHRDMTYRVLKCNRKG